MENKELKKVTGQCCCKIVGKPSVYETDSCCLADVKKEERCLLEFSEKYRIPFRTYTAQELQAVPGEFHSSEFVKAQVGVDNVCERAALKAAGTGGWILLSKQAQDGMTVAIAERAMQNLQWMEE